MNLWERFGKIQNYKWRQKKGWFQFSQSIECEMWNLNEKCYHQRWPSNPFEHVDDPPYWKHVRSTHFNSNLTEIALKYVLKSAFKISVKLRSNMNSNLSEIALKNLTQNMHSKLTTKCLLSNSSKLQTNSLSFHQIPSHWPIQCEWARVKSHSKMLVNVCENVHDWYECSDGIDMSNSIWHRVFS